MSMIDSVDQATTDRFNVMICALHNIAVEHEFMKQYVIALNYYQKSRDLAAKLLGAKNPMTIKMDNVFHEAAQKIQRTMERQYQRKMISGNNLRKKEQQNLGKNKDGQTALADIINSGLANMDMENAFKGEMAGVENKK